jgi:hypothetical protein
MYTATYEVNLMMQAFLENGGKTGGDIIHYASVIKEEIVLVHREMEKPASRLSYFWLV